VSGSTPTAGTLGGGAVAALEAVTRRLALAYAGIDFGRAADGRPLFFEANAAIIINPPPPDPLWDYRRAPIGAAIEAARQAIRARDARRRVAVGGA
jgi:hypothetical protein